MTPEPTPVAYRLVVASEREGDPTLTVGDALRAAYDAVDPATVYGTDDVAVAYRAVLARLAVPPTRAELVQLVAALAAEDVVETTPLQEFWATCAVAHELT